MVSRKYQYGWFHRNPSGVVIVTSGSWNRADSINKTLALYGPKYTWAKLYKMGHRMVRIRLA